MLKTYYFTIFISFIFENGITPLKHWVKTLTFDNGREFSWHEKLAENLDCNTYFAKPYHSWERGLNENHNGLLRQFFPKRMALDSVSEKEAFRATDLMNNRPRKCLGWKTPFEVFAKMTILLMEVLHLWVEFAKNLNRIIS